MALFDFKKKVKSDEPAKKVASTVAKKTEEKKPKVDVAKVASAKSQVSDTVSSGKDLARVLIQPRITEKATISQDKGVYVFNVDLRANKKDVSDAVAHLFKVTPIKINMTRVPSKKIAVRSRRGKTGVKSGGKKAYVYLKKGDSISIV